MFTAFKVINLKGLASITLGPAPLSARVPTVLFYLSHAAHTNPAGPTAASKTGILNLNRRV